MVYQKDTDVLRGLSRNKKKKTFHDLIKGGRIFNMNATHYNKKIIELLDKKKYVNKFKYKP